MRCRFILSSLIIFDIYPGLVQADAPAWVCEQTSENKEWRCVTSKKPIKAPLPSGAQGVAGVEAFPASKTLNLNAKYPPIGTKAFAPAPPTTIAKRPGWNCKANAENATWSCSLIGRDPKGQARLMEGQESIIRSWFGYAYDAREEQIFSTLRDELQNDPWAACSGRTSVKPEGLPSAADRLVTPMHVSSDYSEIFDEEITSFYGNVDMQRADQHMMTDMATYDSEADTLDLQGDVYYSESDLALFSKTGFLNLGENKTKLRDVLFIAPEAPLRGSAGTIYRDSPTFSYYKKATFTSCPPANQDWVMHADRLKMNTRTGKASAKHAWLEFKGIPFLYTPYISFPLDDRRLSGFLTPSWGSTERSGFDVQIPYYWNIAPNYDALIWGRYLGKRGPALGTTFRYLTEMLEGSLEVELLPSDNEAGESRGLANDGITPLPTTKSFRGAARFRNGAQFTPQLRSDLDLNYVSDPYYFDDLGNSLHISTESFLRSFANISFNEHYGEEDEDQTSVAFLTQVENYQTIDVQQTSRPYQRLPQILLNLNRESEDWPL